MTCYIVELYDKDNNMWEEVGVCGNFKECISPCRVLADLISRDMIVNRFNDRCEPFDLVQVRKVEAEQEDKVLMINSELTDDGWKEVDLTK